MINIRQKGQEGEREIARMLNLILSEALADCGFSEAECEEAMKVVQRNQNQSAVGGNDLSNTLGLSIEVKRQEQLSVGSWWAQCEAAAKRNEEHPVLMYRQNRKPWHVVTYMWLTLPNGHQQRVLGTMSIEDFKLWWRAWCLGKIAAGEVLRK